MINVAKTSQWSKIKLSNNVNCKQVVKDYLVICQKKAPDDNEVVQTDQAEVKRKV